MKPLRLEDMRTSLIRQEETIIFAFIERAQFKLNPAIYQPGAIPLPDFGGSFSDYMLYETERVHARVRRYTSPDEHPFFTDLPAPVLPAITAEPPIRPNSINFNNRIREAYIQDILPKICTGGDCLNYGSSAVCDVNCLQALSKRIHYGKFIAEAKFQADTAEYSRLIRDRDEDGLMDLLVNKDVEHQLLRRVTLKAATYGHEPGEADPQFKVQPEDIADIYERWIIPLTCAVEVAYLLERLTAPD